MVLLDDFEIYDVVTYLYLQWLPKTRRLLDLFTYIFPWTLFAVLIEYIHINTGHMAHHHGWTFWYSYVADWTLFLMFYTYHKIFHFEKLSRLSISYYKASFTSTDLFLKLTPPTHHSHQSRHNLAP
jgi:hypothetical protein